MKTSHACAIALFTGLVSLQLGGCPTSDPASVIRGGTGDTAQLGTTPSVEVLSPRSDLSISGGTPIEVNWRVVASSRFSTIDVIIDRDTDPDNGNEIFAERGLPLETSSALVDTTSLAAGSYFVGVLLNQVGELAASDYAEGRITVNQRPELFFSSPRDSFDFDRSIRTNPRFDVAWSVDDPDSVVSVQIFLDPDNSPNGNEVLLRESNSQTGDSFSFDLPTFAFEPGTYRILALVSDGVDTFEFYAPGVIVIRSRLSSFVDLRRLDNPNGGVSGAIFEGFNPRDNAGSFVSTVSDIDGDGFAEILIMSQFAKPQFQASAQRTGVGEAYLIYGREKRFSGRNNLNSTGTLYRGDVWTGAPEVPDPIRPSRGITSFTLCSDWDGDGVRELAFGLPFTDSLRVGSLGAGTDAELISPLDINGYFRSGAVVVASGSVLRPDLGFPGRSVINLAEIGTLQHEEPSQICASDDPPPCPEGFYGPKAQPACAGGAENFFNRHYLPGAGGEPNDGSVRLGARFSSLDFGDQFGETISAYEFDSIIFSVPNRDPITNTFTNQTLGRSIPGAGVVSVYYVYAGTGFSPWQTTNGPPGTDTYPGMPESGGLNLIPHGGPYFYIVDDIRLFDGPGTGIFTGSPGFTVDPDDAEDPCNTIFSRDCPTTNRTARFWGQFPGARVGNAYAVDDINADGLKDMVVGSPLSNDGAGASFIVFGRLRDLAVSGELALEELGLPQNANDPDGERIFDGLRIVGDRGDRLGQSQAAAGDFNNDGIFDVLIGSPLINNRQGGAAVFFGSRTVINLTEEELRFDELPDRDLGVIFVGEEEGDLAGARVAGCGDVDGDGNDDILIAAPNRSIELDIDLDGNIDIDRTNCGVVYLIYGSPDLRGTIPLERIGTPDLPGAVFIGRASGDFLGAGLGDQGDRTHGIAGAGDVDGDGRNDLLLGSVSASPRDRARAGETYLLYGLGD